MGRSEAEARILDATKSCCERWGIEKVTVDDIATASGVSRATLYRLFPGGKDVLFDALRVREITEFFDRLIESVEDVSDLEELVVHLVTTATRELRADDHLAIMLASEPGDTLGQLTVDGVPRILRVATEYLAPLLEPFVGAEDAAVFVDVLVRATISYFLAPSDHVDLGDFESTRHFFQQRISILAPSST